MELPKMIKHFSHSGNLELKEDGDYTCHCCGYTYHSIPDHRLVYVSPEYRYRVHLCLVCARVGESLARHALHPQHPLLRLVDSRYYLGLRTSACAVCYQFVDCRNNCFFYLCDHSESCCFVLHLKCAHSRNFLVPHGPDGSPSHSHLATLVVRDRRTSFNFKYRCDACGDGIPIGESHYARCVPCEMTFHIYCDKKDYHMPEMFSCPQLHPRHLLSLVIQKNSYSSCDVCGKKRDWPEIPMYSCLECNNFSAHLSCIVESPPCPFSRSVHDSIAAMRIHNNDSMHEAALCQVCDNPTGQQPVYGCQYCALFVHDSCIRPWLQEPMVEGKIHSHPGFDSHDPLVLVFGHGAKFSCACCEREFCGFMFQRENEKSFVLDLECMLLVPTLEVIGHDHPVILLQDGNSTTETSYLRCIPCRRSFYIGESSCRIPYTLLHECHFHPLTLVSYLTYHPDQSYCDVCEGRRSLSEICYYCAECEFEAHIACVRSEVVGPSSNKLKDVEFVTLEDLKRKEADKVKIRDVFRLDNELQHSYTLVQKELDNIYQTASKVTWENSIGENSFYNNGFLTDLLYSDEPLKFFIQEVNSTFSRKKTRSTLRNLDNLEVVRVGEYLVPLDVEQVIEILFQKYGDFGSECTCSPDAKLYLFVGFCRALRSMCSTQVVRVTEDLLIEWWTCFAMGKAAGFKMQFAFQALKRVVYAHFGLKADKYADGKLTKVRERIKELPEKIEELTTQLDRAKWELEEAKVEEKELREVVFRVKKSDIMTKCLTEAEDLVCYTVGEMLLPSLE